MDPMDMIFEQKHKLLDFKKHIYKQGLDLGYDPETIVRFDNELANYESAKCLEFFYNYDPVITPQTVSFIETTKNGINDDFKNLITEQINKDFSFGVYGDFKIIICNKSGYVNGSQLLKEALKYENTHRLKNTNKPPLKSVKIDDWLTSETGNEILQTIAEDENLKENSLTFEIKGKQKKGEELLQGKYVHPLLVNSLAMFSFFCSAKKRADVPNICC